MGKRRGFTLIELLVVIAIIALLMAILMPALARIRKQAKAVTCQTNLKQWGLCWSMYASTYDGSFPPGNPSGTNPRLSWLYALQPYYREGKLKLCPMATKMKRAGGKGAFVAFGPLWGPGCITEDDDDNPWNMNFEPAFPYTEADNCVSYASNDSCRDDKGRKSAEYDAKLVTGPHLKGASEIPLMVDGKYYTVWAEPDLPPPAIKDEIVTGFGDYMKIICIDRHNMGINGVFVDGTVRRIELKCLWKLKWHRQFDWQSGQPWAYQPPPNEYIPDWPDWMRKLPECRK